MWIDGCPAFFRNLRHRTFLLPVESPVNPGKQHATCTHIPPTLSDRQRDTNTASSIFQVQHNVNDARESSCNSDGAGSIARTTSSALFMNGVRCSLPAGANHWGDLLSHSAPAAGPIKLTTRRLLPSWWLASRWPPWGYWAPVPPRALLAVPVQAALRPLLTVPL